MLIDKNFREFLEGVASDNPTPGGGSVAATVGALGAALTTMVGNLTIDKKSFEEIPEDNKKEMREAFKNLDELTEDLTKLVDEDSTAFDGVMRAFKMPKDTEEEKKNRQIEIQTGYKNALEVPFRCAEKCMDVLKLQKVFAEYGNINAITDVGVGTLLAYAGLEGALFNVKINLNSIIDPEYKEIMRGRVRVMLKEGKELRDQLLEEVYFRLG